MKLFANRVHSRKEAIACFSSFIAKAMSDQSKKSSGGKATTPSMKTRMEAHRVWAAKQKEAVEKITEEKAQMEEVKKQRVKKE